MYQNQKPGSLKGYKIPKKSGNLVKSEVCNVHNKEIAEKVLLETSDYGSNSSGDSLDFDSSDDADSTTNKYDEVRTSKISSQYEIVNTITKDEACDIEPTGFDESTQAFFLQTKTETIDDIKYVIINSSDDFVDVFTEDSKEGMILFQVVDLDENERRIDSAEENSCYENVETKDTLLIDDLELGAVEVVESEVSFESETYENEKADTILVQYKEKKKNRSRKYNKLNANGKRQGKRATTSLLTSVLEKTLLIKLERCDADLNMTVSYDNQNTNPLKRKHGQLEEEWDIVNKADLNKISSQSDSLNCPIKLKIKRRRLNNDHGPEKVVGRQNNFTNTNSPQFFTGFCKICGSNCSFKEAKTYYISSLPNNNPSKPYCCCTCFERFAPEEWLAHNKVCHNIEELSFFDYDGPAPSQSGHSSNSKSKPTFGDRTVMQRDFICSMCFKCMSKLD